MVHDDRTTIILRQYPDGQAIALMPDDIDPRDGTVMSYMHLGQHGAADYSHVIATTRQANPFSTEVRELVAELALIGYDAKYRQRRDRRNRRAATMDEACIADPSHQLHSHAED